VPAELVRVPFIGVDAEHVPEHVADLDALPVTDGFSTGYQAAEMCDLKGGETVLVVGAGPVGLFAMWSAWAMGAGRVIAVDPQQYRLEFAKRWLHVETLSLHEVDIVTVVKGMTEGRGADCSIDAVGCEAAGLPSIARWVPTPTSRPARPWSSTPPSTRPRRPASSR
jgi:threonine dehydrogenase-like Zn-dependent dehydrogenase